MYRNQEIQKNTNHLADLSLKLETEIDTAVFVIVFSRVTFYFEHEYSEEDNQGNLYINTTLL